MHFVRPFCLVLLYFLACSCSERADLNEVSFLKGKWKVEAKESYEVWIQKDEKLIGEAYTIKNGTKQISETLEVHIQDERVVYTPTVPNQNDGKGIPFILNKQHDKVYSFENPKHDYPKKIQYKILSTTELDVSVLGDNNEGFSYKLIRQ